MFGIFRIGSPVEQAISTIADCMILSILWVLCSIPLFTIGAATKALYYASMRNIRNEGSVFRDFFHSFCSEFGKSVCITLLYLCIAGIIGVDLWIVRHMSIVAGKFLNVVLYIACLMVAMVSVYLFPLLARYQAPFKTHLKNAWILCFASPVTTLLLLILAFLPIVLFLWNTRIFLKLLPFIAIFWIGCAANCGSRLLLRLFDHVQSEKEKS